MSFPPPPSWANPWKHGKSRFWLVRQTRALKLGFNRDSFRYRGHPAVSPLRDWGLRGRLSYPGEVEYFPLRSHLSREEIERDNLREKRQEEDTLCDFCRVPGKESHSSRMTATDSYAHSLKVIRELTEEEYGAWLGRGREARTWPNTEIYDGYRPYPGKSGEGEEISPKSRPRPSMKVLSRPGDLPSSPVSSR